ncbi:AI-2E family transporter [Pseudarthrobacter sp. TAF60_1]|uniref:AI-2E family transporter n=1 Tax=Pseudarthrobacter sp. TAF60_1 TaxID=3233071 RepID=UPI003F9E0368
MSRDLTAKAFTGIDRLHEFLNAGPIPVSDAQINATRDAVQHLFTSSSFGTEALTGARTLGEFLIGFLPATRRGKAHHAADRSAVVLGGYVRGTAIVAAADGLIVGVALAILGVPLALPLGVFVFIGGFIPIVGATAAGTLAVAVALISNGPVTALIVLAVVIGANQLEHHFLQPVLMGRVLSIHGLAILLALAAGTMTAGIIGALLAVPVTAVGWTIFKTLSGPDPHTEPPAQVLEPVTD